MPKECSTPYCVDGLINTNDGVVPCPTCNPVAAMDAEMESLISEEIKEMQVPPEASPPAIKVIQYAVGIGCLTDCLFGSSKLAWGDGTEIEGEITQATSLDAVAYVWIKAERHGEHLIIVPADS